MVPALITRLLQSSLDVRITRKRRACCASCRSLPRVLPGTTTASTSTMRTTVMLTMMIMLAFSVTFVVGQGVQSNSTAVPPTISPSISALPSVSLEPSLALSPLSSMAPSPHPTVLCYDDAVQLYGDLERDLNDFTSRRVFKICANTVMDLDTILEKYDSEVVEFIFLTAKSQTTIQCGEEGLVTDNCIIRGGDYGFVLGVYAGPAFMFWTMTGIEVKGLIFEETRQNAFLSVIKGDVTFTDCIWRHLRSTGAFLSEFDPNVGNAPGPDLFVIRFENCIFEDIAHFPSDEDGFEGIIRTKTSYHLVVFNNCIFRNNYFPGTFSSPRGWAVKMSGGTLEIRNTCFYNNTFIGWGLIEAFSNTDVVQEGNFAEGPNAVPLDPILVGNSTTNGEELHAQTRCNLVASSDAMEPQSSSEVICYNATEPFCMSSGYTPKTDQIIENPNKVDEGSSDASSIYRRRMTFSPCFMEIFISVLIMISTCLLLLVV